MSLQITGYPCQVVNDYVRACCFQPNPEEFKKLLSKDVYMRHTSNGKVSEAKGKENVYKVYEEKLFNVTTDIVVRNLKIKESGGVAVKMKLEVDENKMNEGKRYKFLDKTEFTFTLEKGVLKICVIETEATKTEIPQH